MADSKEKTRDKRRGNIQSHPFLEKRYLVQITKAIKEKSKFTKGITKLGIFTPRKLVFHAIINLLELEEE